MENILAHKKWREFYLKDIFQTIQRGRRLKKSDHISGYMPYISSTALNNGVDGYIGNIDNVRIFQSCLTIANSGSVGACFYQSFSFVASDHVTKLENTHLDKYICLFISTIASRLSEKYSFNREMNDNRIKRELIMLPSNDLGEPDYYFMGKYMRDLETKKLSSYKNYISKRIKELSSRKKIVNLKDKNFGEFFIEDIAKILSGQDIYERERLVGITPYITATANNNGIGYFVDNSNDTLESNCISVNRNGSVGYAFYHPYLGLYGNDTRKLRPNVANKYVALFVTQAISRQRDKYGYGYKMGTGRLRRQKILLPIKSDQTPDYEYMEQYMKQIEARKLKCCMEYINKNIKRINQYERES